MAYYEWILNHIQNGLSFKLKAIYVDFHQDESIKLVRENSQWDLKLKNFATGNIIVFTSGSNTDLVCRSTDGRTFRKQKIF